MNTIQTDELEQVAVAAALVSDQTDGVAMPNLQQFIAVQESLQPKTPKGKKKRERLLAAARCVFASKGFVDARVTDVAAEAGVSIGNFYQYFRDKDEMLGELLQSFAHELYSSSSSAGVAKGSLYDTLEHATRGLFEVYARNADLYKILMQVVQIDPKYTQLWMEMRRPFVRRVYNLLKHIPEFERTGLNATYAATALGCMATQSAYLWLVRGWDLVDQKPIDLEDAVQTISHLWYRCIYGSDPPTMTKPAPRTVPIKRGKVQGALGHRAMKAVPRRPDGSK